MKHTRLDLVLVNPGNQKQVYQGLSNTLTAIEPPLWVGLLATTARQNGLSVKVLDAEAEGISPDEAGRRIAAENPLLAAVIVYGSQPSASTQKMTAAGMTIRAIKEHAPDTRTLMGGVHVSALPERTLSEEKPDFACEGEGMNTIPDLIRLLKSDDTDGLGKVAGLWYRNNGHVCSNPTAPLLKELPPMAWDLLPMDRYRAHNWHCFGGLDRQPYGLIYTTLGCPYKCSFCCINAPFGGSSYRMRSPQAVVEEIDLLVDKYGVKSIKFVDEMFVLNYRHVEAICDLLIERDYGLNIWAYARVDTVKPYILEKLKKAGINWLALGIESASQHVRDGVVKMTGVEDIKNTVEMIQDSGIYIIGNYIFGLPDDTMESMQETLDLAMDLNCEFANFYCAMAYPGSKLYGLAVEKRWPMPEKWHWFSQHAMETLPLPTLKLSAGQVLRFRDEAFDKYFTNTIYLESLEKKFGRQTREHIEGVVKHKIKRVNYDK